MTWMQVVGVTLAFLGVYLQFAAWIGRTLRDAEDE
jgi:cell division protein FtsB